MKKCENCNILFDESATSCPKCGNTELQTIKVVPINQETTESQITENPITKNESSITEDRKVIGLEKSANPPRISKEEVQKLLKDKNTLIALAVLVILLVVVGSVTISSLSSQKESETNKAYAVKNITPSESTTNPEVEQKEDDGKISIEDITFPENTYQKISKGYIYSIPNEYESIFLEDDGGLSLLNVTTGESIWLNIASMSLADYRAKKDNIRLIYEGEGKKVTSIYDTTTNDTDIMIVEIEDNEVKTLLAFASASENESHIITISNSKVPTEFQYSALGSSIEIIKTALKQSDIQ